jgi:hypothetical protein
VQAWQHRTATLEEKVSAVDLGEGSEDGDVVTRRVDGEGCGGAGELRVDISPSTTLAKSWKCNAV